VNRHQRVFESAPPPSEQPQGHHHSPDLLTQVQVCARLGISDQTWMRWRKAGRTPEPVTLPSGRRKWRQEDIERLVGAPQPIARRHYFGAVRHARTVANVSAFEKSPRRTHTDGGQ